MVLLSFESESVWTTPFSEVPLVILRQASLRCSCLKSGLKVAAEEAIIPVPISTVHHVIPVRNPEPEPCIRAGQKTPRSIAATDPVMAIAKIPATINFSRLFIEVVLKMTMTGRVAKSQSARALRTACRMLAAFRPLFVPTHCPDDDFAAYCVGLEHQNRTRNMDATLSATKMASMV